MDISYFTNGTSLKRKSSNLTCYCINVRQHSAIQHALCSYLGQLVVSRGHDFGFVFILILVFVFARIARIEEERKKKEKKRKEGNDTVGRF